MANLLRKTLFVAFVFPILAKALSLKSAVLRFSQANTSSHYVLDSKSDPGSWNATEGLFDLLQSTNIHKQTADKENYVALCLAVKDQHRDIREWIEHHMTLGVGKFYVFDHESKVPMDIVLTDYLDSGVVQVYRVLDEDLGNVTRPQMYIYSKCLKEFGDRHTWIGFIDTDEFVFLRDNSSSLPALLKEYEEFGGLGVNWLMFGSSGHVSRPKGGVLANYRLCFPASNGQNFHIKTFANTKYTERPVDPHKFAYVRGKHCVNELKQRVDGPRTDEASYTRVALHHYVTKSLQDYEEKMARGTAMRNFKKMKYFVSAEQRSVEDCSMFIESKSKLDIYLTWK